MDTTILNEQQKKAVEFGDGPLLIIAGAGTGKTTVITERIKYLISTGRATPQEILALTFTEKASREMEERVDTSLPYGMTQMWISTFHAFCDRILRNEGLSIGLDPNYTLMTEAETIQFFRTHLFTFQLSYFRPLGNPNKFISGMIQHFERLKDEDINPTQYIEWVNTKYQMPNAKSNPKSKIQKNEKQNEDIEKYKELANAYRVYEELKIKKGMMDYGDLIAYTLKLFRMRKNILKTYQEQFNYILIDEFQDTNFAQNELVMLLAGKKQNLTTVADDDQSIYRFRGAAISNVIQFRKHFPKTTIVVLTKNYRSTKEILDRSYQLIQNNNPDRLETVEKIDKKLTCVRGISGKAVTCLFADRVENEAELVAREIIHLKNTHEIIQWKDIAILVRANTHAEPFARALSRSGIPYQFLGPGQLFRQPEVKDLICYLKVLYDIHDTLSLFRVLSMDHFQIPPRDIATLISYARGQGMSLFEVCEIILNSNRALIGNENLPAGEAGLDASSVPKNSSPSTPSLRGSEAAQNFITSRRNNTLSELYITTEGEEKIALLMTIILKHLSFVKKETAGQILYFFLEETGILKQYASIQTQKEEHAAENIAMFFDKLKTYEVDHEDASVFAVVDWLDLSMDIGESPAASNTDWNRLNAVNILTVHSAKGLEFPVVFLVNLVNARFPTTEKHEQIPISDELVKEVLPEGDYHMQEERRLYYVGMTRARDLLYFTAAKYYGEGKREKKLSPFIAEALGYDPTPQYSATDQKEKQLDLLDWAKTEEAEISPENTAVPYLSYSQIESYGQCPLQYKYRYSIRIPVPQSAALSFGDTIHKTLYRFYEIVKKGVPVDLPVLLKLFHDQWQSVGYKNALYEEKMKKRGVDLLTEFFKKGFDPKIQVLALEQSFKVKITPTIILRGKIDRVDMMEDGKLEIIDYKTGSAPKKRNPQNDMQLSMYALAATEKGIYGKQPDEIVVSFYFLEGQEKMTGTRTKEQLDAVRKDIIAVADAISKSNFFPTPGKHCDFCEFRLICEAWK